MRDKFLEYPKFLRLWIKNAQIYLDTHHDVKQYQNVCGNAHFWLYTRLFIAQNSDALELEKTGGLFPEMAIDPKKFLEDYFKIDLTI